MQAWVCRTNTKLEGWMHTWSLDWDLTVCVSRGWGARVKDSLGMCSSQPGLDLMCSLFKDISLQYPFCLSADSENLQGYKNILLAKGVALSWPWSIHNMVMQTTHISSGLRFISGGNLNLCLCFLFVCLFFVICLGFFFASWRGENRWQCFPDCHFLFFSQHGIDFASCLALLRTQGQLMMSSFLLLPPCLSRNKVILLWCKAKKGWWPAGVIASVLPRLLSLLHKWNRYSPFCYTASIRTQ